MSDNKTGVEEQAKEPRQAAEVTEALETLRQYGMPLLLGIVIALAIGIPYYLYTKNAESRKAKAMDLLAQARGPKELENIVTAYGSTPAASLAMLRLAKTEYDGGSYDKAAKSYADFLTKFPQHEFRATAEIGKIHCMEARGETEAALDAFARFIEANPKHYLTSQAAFGKARCQQALGKLSDARTTLEDFMAKNPKSRWNQRIEEMLQQIKRAGEVAQAPAMVLTSPITVTPVPAAATPAPAVEPAVKTE
jgi:outer membrane protein assembly factor BamD (BamD/ComL family)